VIGGKGVFTKELEDALLAGRIDIAVHSLKDLPTVVPGRLRSEQSVSAMIRDALVLRTQSTGASLSELAAGAVVGTSSQRRLAQRAKRADVVIKDLRGNVDTRIRKLDEGQYDALILAAAGLRRLGLQNRISFAIPTDEMLPAVGQGAIAVEARSEDELQSLLCVNSITLLRESLAWPNVRCFAVLVAVVSFQSPHMAYSIQSTCG
jgi:hydroxymethylbilane synthase